MVWFVAAVVAGNVMGFVACISCCTGAPTVALDAELLLVDALRLSC